MALFRFPELAWRRDHPLYLAGRAAGPLHIRYLDNSMRIATYNVNGINGRLANLLGWLEEATPDIVCLQELKALDEKFPAAAIRAAGYGMMIGGIAPMVSSELILL
jgi:hypothetical protein